jgi:hypothetical protein
VIRRLVLLAGASLTMAAAGCGGSARSDSAVCSNSDGALDRAAFVFVDAPRSGERVLDGFHVTGCSSTFEATVSWRLRGKDGHVLASGSAQGGGLTAGKFEFAVRYPSGSRQVGHLEVSAPRVTKEGFPPVKNVVPLVLEP